MRTLLIRQQVLPTLLAIALQYWAMQSSLTKGQHIQILKEPSSLIIPTNVNGTFSCKAKCDHICLRFWLLNGSTFHLDAHDQRMHLEYQGNVTSGYTLTLTVNASLLMNNTQMGCRFEAGGDRFQIVITRPESAVLYVLSEPPKVLTTNPSLVRNATHFTLLWSPPFLWPGHRIEYFNVSVANSTDPMAVYYRVNGSSSYDSRLMSFFYLIGHSESLLFCSNVTFSVSAVENTTSELLQQTFSISNLMWILPLSDSEFAPLVVNSTILFKADRTPALVQVHIQLPVILSLQCNSDVLNFSLVLESEAGDVLMIVPVATLTVSGVIMENIVFEFDRKQMYSLRVIIDAYSLQVSTTKHFFCVCELENTSCSELFPYTTSKQTPDGSTIAVPYKGLLGVFVALTALLLLILGVLIACLCIHRRNVRRDILFDEVKRRACDTMIHNPIYDGEEPVYDTVQTNAGTRKQLEAKNDQLPVYNNCQLTGANNCCESALDDQAQNHDAARYVDQPVQLSATTLLHTTTSSSPSKCAAAKNSNESEASTTVRKMSLKKNGQERNKLHLTLPLEGNDYAVPTKLTPVNSKDDQLKCPTTSCKNKNAEAEEYTVMRPVGSLLRGVSRSS